MNEGSRAVGWKASASHQAPAGAAAELCSAWCDEIIGMSAETGSEPGRAAQ